MRFFFFKCAFFVSAVGNLQYLGVFNRLPDCERDLLKLCCFETAALKLSLVPFRIVFYRFSYSDIAYWEKHKINGQKQKEACFRPVGRV